MSEAEVEVVRRAAAAYTDGGGEAVLEFLHPDVEWRARPDLPDAGVYHGEEGFLRLTGRFDEVLEDIYLEPVEIIGAGERVIARLRWGGRGKGSGVEFEETEETWVFTIRRGKITRVDEFATKEEALAAAGLAE
jgi:ketosteroid isomerase-like protein